MGRSGFDPLCDFACIGMDEQAMQASMLIAKLAFMISPLALLVRSRCASRDRVLEKWQQAFGAT
jgi:hypothetical protein